MAKPVALASPLRIPKGMVERRLQSYGVDGTAPTELLPVLGDPVAEVRRSGEYKISPETEALMKSVRDAAVAETTRELTIQALTKEMTENTRATIKLSDDVSGVNRTLIVMQGTQEDHGRQLAAMWDEKKSKNSAWHAMMPTVVGTLISSVLLAALAMSGAFTPKETPAPPAPKTTPAP